MPFQRRDRWSFSTFFCHTFSTLYRMKEHVTATCFESISEGWTDATDGHSYSDAGSLLETTAAVITYLCKRGGILDAHFLGKIGNFPGDFDANGFVLVRRDRRLRHAHFRLRPSVFFNRHHLARQRRRRGHRRPESRTFPAASAAAASVRSGAFFGGASAARTSFRHHPHCYTGIKSGFHSQSLSRFDSFHRNMIGRRGSLAERTTHDPKVEAAKSKPVIARDRDFNLVAGRKLPTRFSF